MSLRFSFSTINLGCPKNFVDLEYALGILFSRAGKWKLEFFEDPFDADVEYVLVNTCGFLSTSRQEAQHTLRELVAAGKKVVIMGCYLVSEEAADFLLELQNIHAIVPFWKYSEIDKHVLKPFEPLTKEALIASLARPKDSQAFLWKGDEVRTYLNSPYRYAHLKIAEGCDGHCTFCRIPKIRGKQISKPIEEIVQEIGIMVESGIREIEIISQNTTNYGSDLGGKPQLIELLQALEASPLDFRYRLFYCYPDLLTDEVLAQMSRCKKMIPYFDIPFQHVSGAILQRMGRFGDEEKIRALLQKIRKYMPNAYVRTNVIVGFPGETDADVQAVCAFLEEKHFDSVALFGYHDEEDVPSYLLDGKLDDAIILQRMKKIDTILQRLRREKKRAEKGQEAEGYLMGQQGKKYLCRREIHAPEIDELDMVAPENILLVENQLEIGAWVKYVL